MENNSRQPISIIEASVDEAIALISSGQETLESCALRYGALWSQMSNAVRAALQVQTWGNIHRNDTAKFDREALWQKLQPEIRPAPKKLPTPLPSIAEKSTVVRPLPQISDLQKQRQHRMADRQPRNWWRIAAAVALFLVVGSLVTVVGAEASKPSDALYGWKLNFEQASQLFALSPAGKVEAELSFAQQRLTEINQGVTNNQYSGLDRTFNSYLLTLNSVVNLTDSGSFFDVVTQLKSQLQQVENIAQAANLPPYIKTQLVQTAQLTQNQISTLQKRFQVSSLPPVPTVAPPQASPTSGCVSSTGDIYGQVTAIDKNTFTIAIGTGNGSIVPLTVQFDANTRFIEKGKAVAATSLQLGMNLKVRIEGTCNQTNTAVEVDIL